MKTCTKCKSQKPVTDFCKRNRSKDGLNHWCKQCVNINNKIVISNNLEKYRQLSREWDKKNRPRRFESEIKHKFNITVEIYNEMLQKQDNACGICKVKTIDLNKRLAVDHCHLTNKVRGLLCGKCNMALGLFNDDLKILKTAINYLGQNDSDQI